MNDRTKSPEVPQPAVQKTPQQRYAEAAWDALISEKEAAEFLGVKVPTLQKYRCTGNGPKFARLSPRCIRYRRSWLEAWANEKVYSSTSAYPNPDTASATA